MGCGAFDGYFHCEMIQSFMNHLSMDFCGEKLALILVVIDHYGFSWD
jgi:hypothetical protein